MDQISQSPRINETPTAGSATSAFPSFTISHPLDHKQRIINQLRGEEVDRVPMFGGWNLGVRNLAEIAGITVEQYLRNPEEGVMRANRSLGVDGMAPPVIPRNLESIRDGNLKEETFAGVEPEALEERGAAVPESEKAILQKFDAVKEEKQFRTEFESSLKLLGDIVLIPTIWRSIVNFSLYFQYGYEAFLSALALYPDEVERIWWEDSILTRERNKILARLYREYNLVPLLFAGHDICTHVGPMCSPLLLRQRYWPHAKRCLEPLLDAGIRVVHHCDGNVMPLIDDMISAGISGFQGFQYECAVDPYQLRERRSLKQEIPLFMAGLSVTRTLPFGSEQDVIDEVDYILDYTQGGEGLFLFTSNVTGVEVPPKNIVAAYRHLSSSVPGKARQTSRRQWPWGVTHPESVDPIAP